MRNAFGLILLMCMVSFGAGDEFSVEKVAQHVSRPAGVPKYSDVCMSSRWKRPQDAADTHDTLRDAAAMHATRIEWCYSFDADWIKKVKAAGYFYGGTLNSCLADQWPFVTTGELTYLKGRVHDRKGNMVCAPWMSMWTPVPYWGCVNSPEYRKIYLDCAKYLIDAGADAIQTDDPTCNISTLRWGGCFCEYCVSKAAIKYADLENEEELAAFTDRSVKEFYDVAHTAMKKMSSRNIATSSNNFGGRWMAPYDMFDYGIAEYDNPTPESIYKLAQEVSKNGKSQTITLRKQAIGINRKTIALCYSTGVSMLCPYDVYLRSTPEGSERLFIEAEKVADIYGFVRANADYLDGYEDAAISGDGLTETRYGKTVPLDVQYKGVYGFVRAKPKNADAPVVIHLLDWVDAGRSFNVAINNASYFGKRAFDAKLLMPVAYDAKLHEACEKSKDYSPLSETVDIKVEVNETTTTISVPPVNPWAMLVLTPRS